MRDTRHPSLVQQDMRMLMARNNSGYYYMGHVARARYNRAELPTYFSNALLRSGVFHPEAVSDSFLLSRPGIGVGGLRIIRDKFPADGSLSEVIAVGLFGPSTAEELAR